jgi:hypothetical protein
MQISTLGRTFRRLALVTAGVCTLVIGLSVGGVPASASAADATAPAASVGGIADASLLANCPADSLCIFQHRDFLGEVFVTPAGTSRPTLHAFECRDANRLGPDRLPKGCDSPRHGDGDGNWGDQMSSWVNNTSLKYCWSFDINFGNGGSFPNPMLAGQSLSFLSSRFNDEASSMRPC